MQGAQLPAWLDRLVERARAVARRALGIEDRLGALERTVHDPGHVAAQLQLLGSRTRGGKPYGNYFNERFRNYELALLNVKQLAYQMGRLASGQCSGAPIAGPLNVSLTSRMCLQSDLESDWLAFWCDEMRVPRNYHRKLWEMCYVAQAIYTAGKLQPGCTGLGFGCGEEMLPSLFVKYGASILVTDQEPESAAQQGWTATNQHTPNLDRVRMPHICDDPARLQNIDLRYVDMNAIPADLDGCFDFCWSACALEHLGSIANGLAFIENSLKTLKPGGVAVHTLEFNLAEDEETIDNWPTVLFQKRHLVAVAERLSRAGYQVSELDFSRGDGFLDGFVDVPPWSSDVVPLAAPWTQLKLSVDGFVCTSFGIIVRVPEVTGGPGALAD